MGLIGCLFLNQVSSVDADPLFLAACIGTKNADNVLENAHKSRICIDMFIEVSVRAL